MVAVSNEVIEIAQRYAAAGLSVVPIRADGTKAPAVSRWQEWQQRIATPDEIGQSFSGRVGIAIVGGKVSGNLECLDIDLPDLVEPFEAAVRELAPGLLERLPTVATPRNDYGGRHYRYRLAGDVAGNQKLAQSRDGKATWIETRGEGGYAIAPGSPGECHETGLPYKHVAGPPVEEVPTIDADERGVLMAVARSFNQRVDEQETRQAPASRGPGLSPGDDFNQRATWQEILAPAGWTSVYTRGDVTHWRRPGKARGISATTGLTSRNGTELFCVFSSNAYPFEGASGSGNCTSYSKFAAYAVLNHGGDFSAAASDLAGKGYGQVSIDAIAGELDHEAEHAVSDPGTLPVELLRVPGFVSEVMDYCFQIAPYPNEALAFCGAMALQALLAGRKVRDPLDNRTNIYLLALAYSASGKDAPRKANVRIAEEVGMLDCLGNRLASGEGIEDAIFATPAMLFQTDEIDGLLQSINKAKNNRFEGIMHTLLQMYSHANSQFAMRRLAGKEPGFIDQPCLVLHGTAIPTHYYEALSQRMLTNGFFARTITVESGGRGTFNESAGVCEVPERVLATARWWRDFLPGSGNLEKWHPTPATIRHTPDATAVMRESRELFDSKYRDAEDRRDPVATTVWGRANENCHKLALNYGVSANHQAALIGKAAVRWATDFVVHQTRRMLFMAAGHVSANQFDADCLKIKAKLRESPGRMLSHSQLLRHMRTDAQSFQRLMQTLLQRGEVELCEIKTATKSGSAYHLTAA
jgi:hypothetical protein